MLNCLKQFRLSFVKYRNSFDDNLRKKLTEKIPRRIKKSSSMQINAKILQFLHLNFLTILQMPSWCQMLNGLITSCSVSLKLFHNFDFLAISDMPCWCQMLNWLKQLLFSLVKYRTSFGDNLWKKLTEQISQKN